ncbi:MAG: hypothetical protein DI551_01140 [Micavibrio aeruginosavorus]|uniref:Uncharacterized protein n=1 Tax=Micavibrio aeruginosavorus TaxID=349221 RepID=A0A2W5N852_9BACT|nr:MAG: hypothetical protein DI551_01140 [Micavibrio aeruginosavorus]
MTIEIDEATCSQVAKFLPKAIEKAFNSYYDFIEAGWQEKEEEAPAPEQKSSTSKIKAGRGKQFADHHAACKAALAHIELLLKLGSMTQLETRADYTHLALLKHAVAEADAHRAETLSE